MKENQIKSSDNNERRKVERKKTDKYTKESGSWNTTERRIKDNKNNK